MLKTNREKLIIQSAYKETSNHKFRHNPYRIDTCRIFNMENSSINMTESLGV